MNSTMTHNRSTTSIAEENVRFMTGVYKWMCIGLLLTSTVAYAVSQDPNLVYSIVTNKLIFWGLVIAQLGAVFYLSAKIKTMSALTATMVFIVYALLTGLTLSSIFLIYTQDSILSAFLLTSFSFGCLSLFGFLTRKDLGPIGTFCHMGLYGIIGFSLIAMFFPNLLGGQMGKIFSFAGVIVFAGLTAYDTQKIKQTNILGNEGTEEDHKETIMGALTLYLDFINLFLMLLRLMGNRRN